MKKRIFIIGQCSLHWGRMEFGNIGNYYIVKPMFEQLRRVFPDDEIVTTMQFSDGFCKKFGIITAPLDLYYDFDRTDNLSKAQMEYASVLEKQECESSYVREVKKSDLVIDFSGDIWGDNADFLGKDRFQVGLYKDLTAQALKPTIMISGSPGPFDCQKNIEMVKTVFSGFELVINRESASTRLLGEKGFNLINVQEYPCPSFLFQPADRKLVEAQVGGKLFEKKFVKVGWMLCGWNFEKGPYTLWPRSDNEYDKFVRVIENLVRKYHVEVYLLSHSNGFDPLSKTFSLLHGRDFPIMQQLKKILDRKGLKEQVTLLDGIYSPEITKGIIGNFDLLISGRMHGAVAGLSQTIPTVILDYGHEPKAHKLHGFAEVADVVEYIADPCDLNDMLIKTEKCLNNRVEIKERLKKNMLHIEKEAVQQFDLIKKFANEDPRGKL